MSRETAREPGRVAGSMPIQDYAAIGDGETVALVALDGSIDSLWQPTHDADPVLGALLDADAGGSFVLRQEEPSAPSRPARSSRGCAAACAEAPPWSPGRSPGRSPPSSGGTPRG